MSQGGSTITQQLAKNLFLTQERTLTRKLQEAVLALWLEHKFSKAQILELYLNRVYFGVRRLWRRSGGAALFRQIGAAGHARRSRRMLAGLVKSPSRLAPTHNFERAPSGAPRWCSRP